MTKKTIAVDLDGVGYDFVSAFRQFVATGTPGTVFEDATTWNFPVDQWGWTQAEFAEQLEIFTIEEGYNQAPPITGFAEALTVLAEEYNLVGLTCRPEAAVEQTHDWAERWGVNLDSIWFVTNPAGNKADALTTIGADYLVDDHVEHCRTARRIGVTPVLFTHPSNAELDSPDIDRVFDWQDAVVYFEAVAQA